MEIEQVRSLETMVGEILNNIKEIANKKPETRIRQDSVDTFNNILRQVRSIEELKANPVIGGMKNMVIPSSFEEAVKRGPKASDLVINLSAIHGALLDYKKKHEHPLRKGGV